ncbi:MAG TPA: DUF2073 domain-containing protein [Methanocorpusculum sp.]|nr:DUF2073 domain-containing protein [Methanocorpusculum sp.]HJJ89793.1 DUF2073 domain-containing protein [Methanocorpusculum sp.]
MIQGVQIDMLSSDRLSKMTSMEKIRLILDDVHQGYIVVLEKGLTPEEQGKLLETTMMEISPGGFSGIEIETYPSVRGGSEGSLFSKLFGGGKNPTGRLMVIGPVDQLKMITREKDRLIAWASSAQ